MPGLPRGVIPAVLTPLTDELAPDHPALAQHCRWLLKHGCDALAVLGTNGEANSFSVDERISILEALVQAGIAGGTLIAGTGCCAIPDTVRLTRAALDIEAAGVLMLPPFYYKGVSDDGVYAAFAETFQGVGDSRLAVLLYHFPALSGVPITPGVVERLQRDYPGVVVGLKDSSGDVANMQSMIDRFPGFAVFSGSDEFLLPILDHHGAGCITGVCNIAAPLAAEVYAAWRNGNTDAAARAQARLSLIRETVARFPLTPALKAIMADHTGRLSWRNIRPPLMPIDAAACAALSSGLDRLGFAPPPVE